MRFLAFLLFSAFFAVGWDFAGAPAAIAGNGVDRGGVGTLATLEGLLPKRIRQQVMLDYRFDLEKGGHKPLVGKESCGLVFKCSYSPDWMTLEYELELVTSPWIRYEPTRVEASYVYRGKRYKLDSATHLGSGNVPMVRLLGWDWAEGHQGILDPDAEAREGFTETGFMLSFARNPIPRRYKTWINGESKEIGEAELKELFLRAESTLARQTDYDDVGEARELFRSVRALEESLSHLGQVGMPGFAEFRQERQPFAAGPRFNTRASWLFVGHIQSSAEELSSYGKAAVSEDGSCDARAYDRLIARLKDWKVGSPAYFYELNMLGDPTLLSERAQLSSLGLRQRLRNELNGTVARFCEPKVEAGTRVDLVLSDR